MPSSSPAAPDPGDGGTVAGRLGAPVLELPALLFGRYRLQNELGRGGMGLVILATDEELGQPVAVKVIPDVVLRDTEAIADLKREVLRGMSLLHPNIVRTHNFERDATTAAIIMEYVEGQTLADLKLQQTDGCFGPSEILPWLEQLCPVLEYAHRDAKIAHLDLKPRNLILTPEGRLKVADFGIASQLNESVNRLSASDKYSGTPPYMSPQQALGERPSHLDDIYSLGATIYELLTSKPPFFRGHILSQVLNVQPPAMMARLRELELGKRPALPPAWEQTVAACLSKEPAGRPQSAAEVLQRLNGRHGYQPSISPNEVVPVVPLRVTPAAPTDFSYRPKVQPAPSTTIATSRRVAPPPAVFKPRRRRLRLKRGVALAMVIILLAVGVAFIANRWKNVGSRWLPVEETHPPH